MSISLFVFYSTLKHSWQKLGSELCKLGDLHAEKVRVYTYMYMYALTDLGLHAL